MSSELASTIASLQIGNYLTLVTTAAVTYDYVITFPDEINHIWVKKWSAVSFLFVLVRYVGLAVVLIESLYGTPFIPGPALVSTVLLLFSDLAFVVFLAAADIMMILRVYAMYNKSKIVLGVLLLFWAATVILYTVSAIYYNSPDTYMTMTIAQVLNMSFCNPTYTFPASSKLGSYKAIPRLTLAGFLFLLVIVRLCVESYQMYKATKQWKPGVYLGILAREGVLYFFVHVLNNVNFGDSMAGNVTTTIIFTLLFVLSPRFIMNVRELYARRLLYGSSSGKGIDTGFGIRDSPSSGILPTTSSVGFLHSGTPGMTEEYIEMQGVGMDAHSGHSQWSTHYKSGTTC